MNAKLSFFPEYKPDTFINEERMDTPQKPGDSNKSPIGSSSRQSFIIQDSIKHVRISRFVKRSFTYSSDDYDRSPIVITENQPNSELGAVEYP